MPITEDTPTVPVNPYGAAKLAAEDQIRAYARTALAARRGFQATILRYFNVYGADPRGRLGEYPRPELAHVSSER
jgi:UDP-arabinose 4-epimerase